jgi:hypothetical protein
VSNRRDPFLEAGQYVDWETGSPSGNGLGAAAIEVEAAAGFEATAFGGVGMGNAFREVLRAAGERWVNGVEVVVEIGRKTGSPAFAAKDAATAGGPAIGSVWVGRGFGGFG